jgi:hypothetical protein
MKRRKFLKSLSISLPSAYLLTTDASHAAGQANETLAGHGCGRTNQGDQKPRHRVIARDFYDPYLELIRLVKEASEIEHSLMIQYIFAAYSLKPKYRSIVGSAAPSSDSLLGVAIEEMQHLAAANKLLVALGSNPNLERQDFPYESDIYPFPLSLERLSRASLARYTYVEAGRESIPYQNAPSTQDQKFCDQLTTEIGNNNKFNHVAGVYGLIIKNLKHLVESNRVQLADPEDWIEKLEYIMNEGETQHFRFFRSLFMSEHPALSGTNDPWDLPQNHPDYPSFNIQSNPTAYWGHDNQIISPEARAIAWLSNLHYWMVLMMLDLHYRDSREALNSLAQTHMVGPLQSLATILADYGTGLPFDKLSLGYSSAPNAAGNLKMILRLNDEAATLATKMGADLPPGYPLGLHAATKAIVAQELETTD